MASLRQHGTTLLAGLIVLGVLGAFGGAMHIAYDLDRIGRGVAWFCCAFVAAHLAKRLLPDLDNGALCTAALVVTLLALGIEQQRDHEPIDVRMLVQLGLMSAGAITGALTARRPLRTHRAVVVLAAGAASFGAAILAIGFTMLFGVPGIGLVVGAWLGALVTALLTDVRGRDTAWGLAVYCGVVLAAVGVRSQGWLGPQGGLFSLCVGAAIGAALGGLGGRMARALRPVRRGARLPEARRVD